MQVLHQLPKSTDPSLLAGLDSRDDAAVYKIAEEIAIVQSVDFFPPNVDDPFTYGEIAVANAVSDIYAMGGTPLLGLNIVSFPEDLPTTTLTEIINGGASKASEAGILIVGGHTIKSDIPIYGMAVTGTLKPGMEITNSASKANDLLILTKPIGSGILTTAAKADDISPELLNSCIDIMRELNDKAASAMRDTGVHACTDITGFGLIGHINEMTDGSELMASININKVPFMAGVVDCVAAGHVPSGTMQNFEAATDSVKWADNIRIEEKLMLCDAQTSGGLLISVGPENLDELTKNLVLNGISNYAVIGEMTSRTDRSLHIKVN